MLDDFSTDRRRLIGAGAILAGAGAVAGSSALAQGTAASATAWRPAPEAIDSWLDKPGTRHRLVLDTTTADGVHEGVGYITHFIMANQEGYSLTPEQLGMVMILRHGSTPFGYNNAMWAKYGTQFAKNLKLTGDTAKQAAIMNPMLAKPTGDWTPAKGMEWTKDPPFTGLASQGVRFAVCAMATEGIAGDLAGKGGDAKVIEAELKANLVPSALMVPAGVIAVNRAQEHGYTFASAG